MTTTRTTRPLPALSAILAVGVLVLGACSSDDSDDAADSTAPSETVTVTADPPETTVTQDPGDGGGDGGGSDNGSGGGDNGDGNGNGDGGNPGDCSGLTAEEAVDRWADEVPLPEEGYPYAPGAASLETYGPCAALSWMVLPVANGTVSSPNQIMLFHQGEYIGTATEKAYGFTPDVIRVSDETISVTWHWLRDGDANADPTGESTAQFTWDASSESVEMSGEVPPE